MENIPKGSCNSFPHQCERHKYADIAQFFAQSPENNAWKSMLNDAMDTLVSSMCTYEKGPDWSLEDDWDDPTVLELEHMISVELTLRIRSAILKIVEAGYTKEVAEWVVLSGGTCLGMYDMETNIFQGAMNLLKDEKKFNAEKERPLLFEDLETVVRFNVLEHVSILREAMGISIAESMWYLLLYGSNLMLLSAAKVILVNNFPSIRYGDTYFDRKPIKETDETPKADKSYVYASKREMLKLRSKAFRKDKKTGISKWPWNMKINRSEEDMARLLDSSKILKDQNAKISNGESSSDERDKTLAILREKVKELEKEKEDWTKWANEKVKQAAKRLGRDREELKQLRADKEEGGKSMNSEKINKNNKTLRKMLEVANMLGCTQAHLERMSTQTTIIEKENRELKKSLHEKKIEVESASEQVKQSSLKEQDLLKRLQEEEKMNNSLAEELLKLKAYREETESNLNKDKARLKEEKGIEAQVSEELKQVMKSLESIRSEREKMIDEANKQQDAENRKLEKYKEEIEKLETQIRVKDAKRLPVFEDMFEEMNENECVMCLNEEKSVVFLPCSHQVVCVKCNEQHEKQGMKECPTCRTTITRRIHAVFIH